jgi:amino acid adenylation domain-containing protein/thioester reductase-like protein
VTSPSKNPGELSAQKKRALLKRLLREKARPAKEAPLSFGQERIWFLDQLTPANAAYCETVSGRLIADLSVRVLTRALNEVVRRHEILRTTFGEADGTPFQRILGELLLSVPVVDLSHLAEAIRESELRQAIAAQSQRPFDLSRGPLLRLTLIRLSGREYFVVVTFHHIVGDAWSVGVFLRELFVSYLIFSAGSRSPLPHPQIQYSEFARWQRRRLEGKKLKAQLAQLKQRLAGLPVLALPTDRPRPAVQSFRGATQSFEFPDENRNALEAMGREEGATPFMTSLMAFLVLLSRYTGAYDIAVGTPVAGRNRVELEGLIGFFVNMVVLRVSLHGDPALRELLRRVRQVCLDAYAHQEVPFERLVEELRPERSLGQEPLVQVVFAHHKDLLAGPNAPGVEYQPVQVDTRTSKFDVTLYNWKAKRDHGLTGSVEYSTELYDASTIFRMIRHFRVLLSGIAAHPEQRLSELTLLGEEERQQLLFEWSSGFTSYPAVGLVDRIERQVVRACDSVAAVYEGEQLSYGELNRRSNQLAHHLRSVGVGPDARVGLMLDRSLEMVVGLLGILKSGGAFVPLDPSYPEERLRFMVKDSGARVMVTHSALAARLSTPDVKRVALDEECRALGFEREVNPVREATPANLAYVIYTSGSTGTPKGVAVTHSNAARLFEATAERFDFGAADNWTLFHSYAFDFSVWELWGALIHGGRLVVVPNWVSRSPEALYDRLRSERITVLNQTPSAFAQLLEVDEERGRSPWSALRLLVFGGEKLEPKTLGPWFDRHGEERPRLVNMYGITETTVHVTYRPLAVSDLERATASMIGKPIPDLRLYVMDRQRQPAPIGVPGELCVGGAGLARCYLDRPDLTAERFIPDPFACAPGERLYSTGDQARWVAGGELQYLGRIDHQVKIRGYRIELGEIESVLRDHPAVRQAVATVRDEPVKRLMAYVLPEETAQPWSGYAHHPLRASEPQRLMPELQRFVSERLPGHMVPSAFVMLDELPIGPNGKVDRRALPAPGEARPEPREGFVAPRTPVEAALAGMWSEVLGRERVGVHDDFFELGGHSLLATRMVSRIRRAFQAELPLIQLFEKPTIAGLAEALLAESAESRADEGVDFRREAVLDGSIKVGGSVSRVATPRNLLLTGATGFLGAFLLHDLLVKTRADIYCLVRAPDSERGRERIQAALDSFGLGGEGSISRIIPVPGDLSRPYLGLSAARFDELASRLDVIYHNGAMVNAVYPYSFHKPTNVLGTQEVLRLACRSRAKLLHYVSTTGVAPAPSPPSSAVIREEDVLDDTRLPDDGYSRSKWVAERMVVEARSRGLPVSIYRPGRITGHSRTGVSNDGDLFSRILKTCIQLGKVPLLDPSAAIDMVPVDYVSQALVHLSGREDSLDRVFHLVNPRPITWRELVDWIVEFGYPLQEVPFEVWIAERNRLVEESEGQVSAALGLPSVAQLGRSMLHFARFDSRNTLEGLEGTSISCATADAQLLSTYFSHWIQSGYLQPPRRIPVRER